MNGFKKIHVLFGLLFSMFSYAQTDLAIVSSQTNYQFAGDGQENIITFDFDNFGVSSATGGVTVTFTKDMFVDQTFDFSSVSSGDYSCSPSGDSMICNLTLTSFDPGATTSIDLGVIIQPGDFDLSPAFNVNITDQSGQDSDLSNNNIFVDIQYSALGATDFEVTLQNPQPPIQYPEGSGTQVMLFEITNQGPFDEGDQTTVTFDISPDLDPQFINPPSGSSSDPAWNCFTTTGQVTCDYFSIFLAGSSSTIELTVPVPDTAPIPSTITNAVGVSMFNVGGDSNPSNNTFQYDIEIVSGGAAEIDVLKTIVGGSTQIVQGSSFEYDIQVNNTGVVNAVNVDLSDTLPPEVTYINHTNLGNFVCTYAAPTLSCNAANLPNTTAQDGVRILVSADGTINSNVINTASSTFADSNSTDNSSSTAFTIIAPDADLDLAMVADAPNYTVGDLVTLNLTLHNPFSSTGAPPNTTVVTTLPNEVIFNSAQVTNVAGWSCIHDGSPTGGAVTCSSMGNPVAIGTNTFIDIVAVADGVATTVSPFATVTSDFDPNPSNDTANTAFEIFPGDADLSLQFLSAPGVYNQGDSIVYDIQVDNPIGSTANPSDTRVDVLLPTEVSYTNSDLSGAPGWFCSHDGSPTGGALVCDRQGAAFVSASTHDMKFLVLANTPATAAIVQATISSAADTVLTNNTDSQSDVINAVSSDFSIAKSVNVTDATIGDSFTYVLTVTNDPASTAAPTDVSIVDSLPAEVTFGSFIVGTNLGTTINCSHDGSATGGVFSCDTNTTPFPIGEVVTIDINVTAAAVNPAVVNTATVQTSTDPDGTTNNNTASSAGVNISVPATTTLAAVKDAQVAGVTVTEVSYEQQFDYVLTVTNTGASDATNVHVSDNLPPEVTLMGFDTTGWTCLPLNTNAVNQVVDCNLDNALASGNSATIILNVMATNNTAITSITNQMSTLADNAAALVFDVNTVNLLNSTAIINIAQTPSPVDPGNAVGFDVVFSNTGGTDLNGVQLTAALPQGFAFNGFSGDPGLSCTENAGVINCNFTGPVTVGANILLSLDLTTPAVLNNQQYVLQVSGNANELSAPVVTNFNTIFSTSDLTLTMFSDPLQVNPGQTFNHIANIVNTGNLPMTDVTAVLAFPETAQFLGVSSSDMTCSVSGSIVTCSNIQIMASGDNYLVTFNFRANSQPDLFGSSLSVDADGIGRSTSATTEILGSSFDHDLALIKSASVTDVQQRQAFSYQFDVNNLGVSEQAGFMLSDQLPEGVIFQAFSGDSWSCEGDTFINCQFLGSLPPGASTQLVFDVLAPDVVGLINNTATLGAQVDDNPGNNQSSATVQVTDGQGGGTVSIADLAIEITSSNVEPLNSEEITWQINLTNKGPDAAHDIEIESALPVGFNATEVSVENDMSCVLLTDSLVCSQSILSVNASSLIELKGSFSAGFSGMMMNMVSVNANSVDPIASNNQSQVQINVVEAENLQADLALEFQATTQDIRQGQTFEMTINTSNNGPDSAFDTTLNIEIGGLISQVQVVNSGQWMCQTSTQSLSCQFPGGYPNGLSQGIDLLVTTQEVVQVSEPIQLNGMIESSAIDPHPGNNMAGFSNNVTRTPTEDEIFTLFEDVVGSGASETVLNTIRSVSSYCARSYFMAIEGLCEEMIASARPENRDAIINAMEEMTPNEVIGQTTSAAEIMTSQFRNVTSRLAQLRGGGGSGVSVAGLTARYGNESLPLGLLAYLNQSEDEAAGVSNINDFVSPWGFFVNGNISMGERDATGRELGFDFDTYGLTAGVDYRFSPTKVAGVALGYANFDSEIEDEAEMKSTGFTLTGYGSFYVKDNFYVDGRISYGKPDFEQKRRINFQLDNIAIDRVATGKTDADQYTVAMSMGYHFNKNAWNITPNASFRYTRTTIDNFVETGAGDFNFRFGEQEVKSMVWSLGTSVSKAISLKNGVLSPQFDINISRETENDGGFVEARFINAPDDEIFLLQTDEPDRTYGSAGIGLVFIGANGKQAYINYKSIFGLDGFTRGTINLGARFEF
jgi:uncharacterized repeat protein (TIGR01451 family)